MSNRTKELLVELGKGLGKYKTKAGAAAFAYKILKAAALESGGSRLVTHPDVEVWIKSPEDSEIHGYVGSAWHVCWESGPTDWAVGSYLHGPWGYCETYWGFDLIFYT